MSKRPRILVTCPAGIPPFASLDAELLALEFDTEIVAVSGMRSIVRLRRELQGADAMLVWFLGRYAVPAIALARTTGVPIVSVIGGFEVAWIDTLRHGIRPGSTKDTLLRWMIKASESVISVSEFSRSEALTRFPDLRQKFVLIHNAVDTKAFFYTGNAERREVMCAGAIDENTIPIKSWGLFREVARRMPEIPFVIAGQLAGQVGREFVRLLPTNVKWLGVLDKIELADQMRRASVYTQLSIYESFGVALAEAMSCGCFPVVSNRGALPEVVGSEGVVVSDLTPNEVERAIRVALDRPDNERANVRTRIEANFALEQRRKLLTELFRKILSLD